MPGGFKVIDANGQSLAYFYGHQTRVMLQSPKL
jgi:hypothetical protein